MACAVEKQQNSYTCVLYHVMHTSAYIEAMYYEVAEEIAVWPEGKPSEQCLASSIIHSSLNLLSFHLYMRAPYNTNTVSLITYIGSEMNMSKECELQVLIICTVFVPSHSMQTLIDESNF